MLEAFLTPKCSVIFESSAKLITSFRYSSGTTIWHITFHSSYTVASDGRHFFTDDSKMTEHLGVKKASNMILAHLNRSNIRRHVAEDCRTCSICKVMGKPNQNICVAPLRPVPVSEVSLCRVIVDCDFPFILHSGI
jgi:hypothetical protein